MRAHRSAFLEMQRAEAGRTHHISPRMAHLGLSVWAVEPAETNNVILDRGGVAEPSAHSLEGLRLGLLGAVPPGLFSHRARAD